MGVVGQQLSGGVVDRRDVVGIEGMPEPEGVGQYADPESDAEEEKLGLWAGRFDEPEVWRAREKAGR